MEPNLANRIWLVTFKSSAWADFRRHKIQTVLSVLSNSRHVAVNPGNAA
jgi:hypothetical protein